MLLQSDPSNSTKNTQLFRDELGGVTNWLPKGGVREIVTNKAEVNY